MKPNQKAGDAIKTSPAETKKLFNQTELSPALSAFAEAIEKTALPFVQIEAVPADDLARTQSKFGGKPYWPAAIPYPVDGSGKPMFLLAQLNFAEVPSLRDYPEKGLLQFYISTNDVYGLNFNDPTDQTDFRVAYFEDVDETTAEKEFAFLKDADFESVPVDKSMALRFSEQTDYAGTNDIRFQENFGEDVYAFTEKLGYDKENVRNELFEKFPSNGHRIGGYAFFTQEDPRKYKQDFKDWILLLQIDSDDHIMWGDAGVANFFIEPGALRRKDFSNVLYNWDCC